MLALRSRASNTGDKTTARDTTRNIHEPGAIETGRGEASILGPRSFDSMYGNKCNCTKY